MFFHTESWLGAIAAVAMSWAIKIVLGLILWKWIMVGVLGLPMLNFFQFVGLQILIRILSGKLFNIGIRQMPVIEQEDLDK